MERGRGGGWVGGGCQNLQEREATKGVGTEISSSQNVNAGDKVVSNFSRTKSPVDEVRGRRRERHAAVPNAGRRQGEGVLSGSYFMWNWIGPSSERERRCFKEAWLT